MKSQARRRVGPWVLLLGLGIWVLGIGSPRAWGAVVVVERPSLEALRQIESLLAAKRSRTPAQEKLDSNLIYAARMRAGEPVAAGVPAQEIDLDLDPAGRVLVDMDAGVTEELLAAVESLGGATVNAFPALDAVRAWLPVDAAEVLAARSEVRSIRQAARAFTQVGNVTSEGDVTHRAAEARAAFGVQGAGVRVGVMSDSVDHLEASQASGDLGEVAILPGQSGLGQGAAGEGTAMLEIVHDVAPGAALSFATAFNGPASFAQNIRDLRFVAGCDVIVDDVGYFNESPFQDDVISQAVNAVTADGALFFSSASNSGNKNDNESGTWEGDFVDSGTTVTLEGTPRPVHRFGTAAFNTVAPGGSSRHVDLFWADPLKGAANDYDVFVLDAGGQNVVASGTSTQNGTQDPYEFVAKLEVGQRILVVLYTGQARYLHLSTGRARLSVSTAGNTRGHSCAVDAYGVAAVDVSTSFPEAFTGNQKNPVETFSSDGPRRVFFHADGTPVTPGNFSATGGVVRQKPDIAAADGGRTTVPGFIPFFGTSAAAPHAAAIAALMKSHNPALTPAQVRTILTETALDIEAPGVDRDSGHGLVMALAALQATPGAEQPTVTGFTPASGGVGTLVTVTGTKLNGATAVRFGGVSAEFTVVSATRVTATVPSGAVTGRVTVVTPSGTATSATDFTVQAVPAVTGFVPASGGVGTPVVLTGVNFTGATAVEFNGVNAPGFVVNSATQITVSVPAGATTGRLTVRTPAGTAQTTGSFTVTASPVLTGFQPTAGAVGTTVTLDGANFTGVTAVRFNGVSATVFTAVSSVRITATVPAGATSGPISVTAAGGTVTSATAFTVVGAPVVTSLEPASGAVGSAVVLRGQNFLGADRVEFQGVGAAFEVESATQIRATVPAGATTGTVSVRTAGGVAVSAGVFTVVGPPANDGFGAAQVLAGASGSVPGTNVGSTKEAGEPDHGNNPGGKSVWFRWVAPGAGAWRFDTVGSGFDTLLAVYTGTQVSGLTLVANSDDLPGGTNSLATFVAAAGTTYWIAVDGFRSEGATAGEAASGSLVLSWSPTTTTPAVTAFAPASGPVGTGVVLTGVNLTGATAVMFNGVAAAFTVNGPTQITTAVPAGAASGLIEVTTPGGVARSLTPFSVVTPVNNDAFAAAQGLSGAAGQAEGSTAEATRESGEPQHAGNAGGRSIWFRWTAPASGTWVFDTQGSTFDTLLAVYTGTVLTNLVQIAANDDASPPPLSQVVFEAQAGLEYAVVVDGYGGAGGVMRLNWSAATAFPVIQSFAPAGGPVGVAVVLTGTHFTGATDVRFNGVSAAFVVDSDTRITATVPVGANPGVITVTTPQGTASSPTAFAVGSGPANDAFGGAIVLTGPVGVVSGGNLGAGKETGEPAHAGDPGGRSVWYQWTAPASGAWVFDTAGSAFDTTLAVYTGTAVNGLTLVTDNDDERFDRTSRVILAASAGVTYRLAVDGYGGDSGPLVLKHYPTVAPQVVFATEFEAAEGYQAGSALAGQQGWQFSGSGGNGVVAGVIPGFGQQAYVGFVPSPNPGDLLFVWPPLDFTPDLVNRPVVRFSAVMAVVDSTGFDYDTFLWSVYNRSGEFLFALGFDNSTLEVFYSLDDGADTVTDFKFENEALYDLEITMDFARNRWSASLNHDPVVTEQPMTTKNATLNLADIDAIWSPSSVPAGDNYLVFDDYVVRALPGDNLRIEQAPAALTVTAGSGATLAVVASGAEPIQYQWQFNGVDLPGATNALLTLTSVGAGQAGTYGVRLTNPRETLTTSAAVTVVAPAPSSLTGRRLPGTGVPEFTLHGIPGGRYRIEVSTDLSQWQELTTRVLPETGAQVFSDPATSGESRRFYRALYYP